MDLCRYLRTNTGFDIDGAPFWNVFFLVVLFWTVSFLLAAPQTLSGRMEVRLPRAITSDAVIDGPITVILTGENILYYRGAVITSEELGQLFARSRDKGRSVLIKADRRASLGRVADVWNLARGLGFKKVNVATDREE